MSSVQKSKINYLANDVFSENTVTSSDPKKFD